MYKVFKKVAFNLDPEKAHQLSVNLLSFFPRLSSYFYQLDLRGDYRVQTNSGTWRFPVGIAAGLDKNAELIEFFDNLGIGGLEVGTVTPKEQAGNLRPRLFRLVEEESILNRMGFNGPGQEVVYQNIKSSKNHGLNLGINIGKNKITPNSSAIDDYISLYERFSKVGNYLAINISSPNTPGLRELQKGTFLSDLLTQLNRINNGTTPLYLKIAPDLDDEQLKMILDLVRENHFSGIIATNTTIMPEIGEGGVSGKLLSNKARLFREKIFEHLGDECSLDVIGVGGFSSMEDIWDFWKIGGKIVQVYTSFIFQGPELLRKIAYEIFLLQKYFGVHSTEELIELIHCENVTFPLNN